jgi:hypothetical protein
MNYFIKGKYYRIGIWALLLTLAPVLGASDIENINIEGLKRTKRETILSIIDISVGDPITEDLTVRVEQKLRKAGIFQDEISVTLSPGEEGQNLDITVYDKWTLIGIPFMAVSDGEFQGGLFALESNLAGRGDYLLGAVYFSQAGDASGFTLFKDPTLFDSDWIGSFFISGGRESNSFTSFDEEDIWEDFFTEFFTPGLGLGRELTDDLTLIARAKVDIWQDRTNDITPPTEGEGHVALIGELNGKYDGMIRYPLFQKGVSSNLTTSLVGDVSYGTSSLLLLGDLRASWARDSLLLAQFTAKGGITNDDYHYLYTLGGEGGSMTLPDDQIATDRYVNGELKGEVRLVKIKAGYITLPLYYEAGYLRNYQEEYQSYHGVGGGMRFYVSKVAIPAMGLDYCYNLTTEEGSVSFFIGASY